MIRLICKDDIGNEVYPVRGSCPKRKTCKDMQEERLYMRRRRPLNGWLSPWLDGSSGIVGWIVEAGQ